MPLETFRQKRQQLDSSGMNYYAYVRDDNVHLAFLEQEKEKMRFVLGEERLQTEKPVRAYTPPQKNIFGTIAFKYIAQKNYLYGSKQEQLKLAEKLQAAGIPFSGIAYNDKRTTVTVSRKSLEAARELQQQAKTEVAELEAQART